MKQTIERSVIAFVLTLVVLMGMGYGRGWVAHGMPTMTPDAAPVPRVAPSNEISVAKQTPLPKAGLP
ncbi:MAG TPA: hypothetical protein VGK15_07390 [Candidatus Limnocylindria bacterium]|jgi:hypothetical protein